MFSREMDRNHPGRANKGYRATGLGKRRNARQSPVPILNLGAGATESFYLILIGFLVSVKLMVELSTGFRTFSPSAQAAQFYTGTSMALYLLKVCYWHQHFLPAFCFCIFRNEFRGNWWWLKLFTLPPLIFTFFFPFHHFALISL